MAHTLADGKTKFTILTTKPAAGIDAPDASELNAGLDASWDVLSNDFSWAATASDAITDQKPLGAKGNSTTYGASNYELGVTAFRSFNPETGAPEPTGEEIWEALKNKGTTVWCYARESGKDADEPWAEGDEIYLGGEVVTDTPQRLDGTGFIRRRIPLGATRMYDNIVVASGE